jgi:hypothetical protein
MTEISGVPTATYLGLLALAMIVFSMLMMCRIVPRPGPAPQVIRHEIVFRGRPIEVYPTPPWLGERIVSGVIGRTGETARLNGLTLGLSKRYSPGSRVALHLVSA